VGNRIVPGWELGYRAGRGVLTNNLPTGFTKTKRTGEGSKYTRKGKVRASTGAPVRKNSSLSYQTWWFKGKTVGRGYTPIKASKTRKRRHILGSLKGGFKIASEE